MPESEKKGLNQLIVSAASVVLALTLAGLLTFMGFVVISLMEIKENQAVIQTNMETFHGG